MRVRGCGCAGDRCSGSVDGRPPAVPLPGRRRADRPRACWWPARSAQPGLAAVVYVAVVGGDVSARPAGARRWSALLARASPTCSAGAVPGWGSHGRPRVRDLHGGLRDVGRQPADAAQHRPAAGRRRRTPGSRSTNERNRFARDLHDILGHSLTVITVKAELANRLLDVDPERARAELADLERLSRDALADVRRAVEGYRDLTLPGELARARDGAARPRRSRPTCRTPPTRCPPSCASCSPGRCARASPT